MTKDSVFYYVGATICLMGAVSFVLRVTLDFILKIFVDAKTMEAIGKILKKDK